jgi:hypothetical protein
MAAIFSFKCASCDDIHEGISVQRAQEIAEAVMHGQA